jgi:hypothetical protein
MTKKQIRYEGEENLEFEKMTGKTALKVFTRLNNKYKGKIMLHAKVGIQSVYLRAKRSEVIEMMSEDSKTKFKNCEESTHWSITQSRFSLSISGTKHQDFEKTKANNWGEEVEVVVA